MVLGDVPEEIHGYIMLETGALKLLQSHINIGSDSLLTIWKNLPGHRRLWTLI